MAVPFATKTARDIIELALVDAGVLGVGQTALAEDINRGLTRLNMMIAQWANKRWLVYHLITVGGTSTGANQYIIGPGGTIFFMTKRPDKLESAFVRQDPPAAPNSVDVPLAIIESRETYNLIVMKGLNNSLPSYVFLDASWPDGVLLFWPVAQASIYKLFVTVKDVLTQFGSLDALFTFPDAYMAAIHWNLVSVFRMAYRLPADPGVNAEAAKALNVLRGANEAISRMQMPSALVRGSGIYDIYSDTFR